MSWPLEKNLLPPDQNNSLLHSIFPLYSQLLVTTPVKEAPLTANGAPHRKPQVDTVQTSVAHGDPSPKGDIYITSPASIAQGTLGKRARARTQEKSAEKELLLERTYRQHRNQCSTNGLIKYKREMFTRSLPKKKNYRQMMTTGKRRGSASQR